MGKYRFTDVFVPGGFPRHTYNPRGDKRLEDRLKEVSQNLCKLAIVTGHTKSGKTVLVRSVLPREDTVWVDGGTVGEEDDFWTTVIDQLQLFQGTEQGHGTDTGGEITGSGKAGANFLIAKGEAEVGAKLSRSRTDTSGKTRSVSSRIVALRGLPISGRALVVDDFHYLPKELQGDIVRALKPLVFDGLPVVIIAIPHRRYDAVKVEKEMTGRILPVDIPSWADHELSFIPNTGFPLLEGELPDGLDEKLATEAIGSPHLMQEFCRNICRAHGVETSFANQPVQLDGSNLRQVFRETAETIGRPIFEKLARGPRQRSDRIPRKLKSGSDTDIYGLVLHALAHIGPALVTIEYEELRAAIREVSATDPPQLHEVARVLKHMSDIAATDQSSTPVIDFDEDDKRLHITDPFFAFYLRWGSLDG